MAAVEVEIRDRLQADPDVAANFRAFDLYQVKSPKRPLLVIYLLSDPNEKRFLGSYSGQALLQISGYHAKEEGVASRDTIKAALRKIRGTVGGLRHVNIVITNERNQDPAAEGFGWSIDAIANWEE